MAPVEVLAIIVFIVLFVASVYMLFAFYICDGRRCKALAEVTPSVAAEYRVPVNVPETGSSVKGSEEAVKLLSAIGKEGLWPLPFIGSAIIMGFTIWWLKVPATVLNYSLVFVTSFITTYFMFAFFMHHYVNPIVEQAIKDIKS